MHCSGLKIKWLLLLTYTLASGVALNSFQEHAIGKVKLLEKIPPVTNDPIQAMTDFLDKVLKSVGVQNLFNGNKNTNLAKVEVPVRLKFPSFSDVIHYHYYPLVSLCESSLERWDCEYCKFLGFHIQIVHLYNEGTYHTRSLITLDHKRGDIVLTYRPGYNIANLLTSLHAVPQQLEGDTSDIRLHPGFLKAALTHFDKVVWRLRTLTALHPHYKLIITGYSLGGSLAAVTMFLLKYRNIFLTANMELYTYGEVRVGNKAFADYFNNLTIPVARVVNQDDFITRINPASLGYYHHHNELFLTDDGAENLTARYCSTNFYEDPNCSQSRGASLLLLQPTFGFPDHITYLRIDSANCLLSDPIEFFLQALWPLRQFIPKKLLEQLPRFSISAPMILFDYRYLLTAGIRNLYKVASKASTYNDNNIAH